MTPFTSPAFFIASIAAGIFGSSLMMAFLYLCKRMGVTNANIFTAMGSLFTPYLDSARNLGWLLHGFLGILFAILYVLALVIWNIPGVFLCSIVGATIGWLHGLVFSLLLIDWVAEHHPMEDYRKSGMMVAGIHWAAHVLYGGLVGLVAGIAKSYNFIG